MISMATATHPRPEVSQHNPTTPKVRLWTVGRLVTTIAVGVVPVLTVVLQPNVAGIATAIAVETLLAAIAFRTWLPAKT